MTDCDTDMLAHYSAALDEIWRLRNLLAYEAGVLEVHLDYATFPKSRRRHAEDQAVRMRAAARGDSAHAISDISHLSLDQVRRELGMSATLTRSQWEADR